MNHQAKAPQFGADSYQDRAPRGGCVSALNGEFYDGGEFLPSTSLPKGLMRKARKLRNERIAWLTVRKSNNSGFALWSLAPGARRERCVETGTRDEMFSLGRYLSQQQDDRLIADAFAPRHAEVRDAT